MKIRSTLLTSLLSIALISISCSGKKDTTETKMETADMAVIYTCSMHPEVESKEPGKCPKCGMDLIKKEAKTSVPMDSTMNMSSDSTKKM